MNDLLKSTLIMVVVSIFLLPITIYSQSTSEEEYTIHVVQRGENLFRIALQYGLSTDELASVNGIQNPASIIIGQRLLVPANTATDNDNTITTADNAKASSTVTYSEPLIHTVQPGETLFRIAQSYSTSISVIAEVNNIIDPTQIYTGQQIIIPGLSIEPLFYDLPESFTALSIYPPILVEGRTGYLDIQLANEYPINIRFLDQNWRQLPIDQNHMRVLLPVPVFTMPDTYPLEISTSDGTKLLTVEIQIIQGPYGNERINLLTGRDNLLNENVENAESEFITNIINQFTIEKHFDGKMSLPAAAAITSEFGTRRSYNGGAFDRYHSGTDFAGVPGTPIFAPATGRIVLADTLNVRGNATIIDHGWGIYTGYWHQSEIYVTVGDFVETGQVIGSIGSTGRVTGAHLHWELWVNGITVDPMQWVQQSFFD